jgi:fumarate reductase subunit D
MAWQRSSQRGDCRRTVMRYRGAAAALLMALAAVGVAEARVAHNAGSTYPVLTVALCAVLVGLAYYLGRTKPAPGTGQRLGLVTRFVSVIPVAGLMFLPMINGLYRLTRRRLYVRNIAITAGLLVFEMATQEFGSPAAAGWAVLQFVALGFAMLMNRKMPAAIAGPAEEAPRAEPAEEAPQTESAEEEPLARSGATYNRLDRVRKLLAKAEDGGCTPEEAEALTAKAVELMARHGIDRALLGALRPETDRQLPTACVVDVSSLAAGIRQLYWLGVAAKFGAVLLALSILSRNNDPESGVLQFTWGKGIVAGAGVLVAFGIAVLVQEDWIRPAATVILGLVVISAVCFVPVSFGALTAADAQAGVVGWAFWPLVALWYYRRQRRSSGLSDAQIQAAGRLGHLPQRGAAGTGHRARPLGLWIRGSIGMLATIPLMVMNLANRLIPFPIVPDWIQSGLDWLWAPARSSVHALFAGLESSERAKVVLVKSQEPGAWSLKVRGDLLQSGKVGAQKVPFGEFLRTRLEIYGDVLTTDEMSRRVRREPGSVVVMPVGVPYSSDAVGEVAALSAQTPLLLVLEPMGSQRESWLSLTGQWRDHGVVLPALDEPERTIAVLHRATGTNVVYVGSERYMWGYLAAIHEAFRTATR